MGNLIVGYDFMVVVEDKVTKTFCGSRSGSLTTSFFQNKEFLVAWGGTDANVTRYMLLLTPYLAMSCNLAEPVVKDTGKTMKITYTLTETTVYAKWWYLRGGFCRLFIYAHGEHS